MVAETEVKSIEKVSDVAFRKAMGSFLTGVGVITAGTNGDYVGLAASSIASASLEPPSLIVCVNMNNRSHDVMLETRKFSVNIMAEDQKDIVAQFARPSFAGDKFSGVDFYEGVNGTPRIANALANIDCTVINHCTVGTHRLFVGQADAVVLSNRAPLAYYQGRLGPVLL